MRNRVLMCMAALMLSSGTALADPAAVVRAQSDAFSKAFRSCDLPSVLELFDDKATIIWPYEGDVATGRPAIEKVLKAGCTASAGSSLRVISADPRALGTDYIVNVTMWDDTTTAGDGKPVTLRVRTTELLHKSGGKWRYEIDHASVGLPPPPAKP